MSANYNIQLTSSTFNPSSAESSPHGYSVEEAAGYNPHADYVYEMEGSTGYSQEYSGMDISNNDKQGDPNYSAEGISSGYNASSAPYCNSRAMPAYGVHAAADQSLKQPSGVNAPESAESSSYWNPSHDQEMEDDQGDLCADLQMQNRAAHQAGYSEKSSSQGGQFSGPLDGNQKSRGYRTAAYDSASRGQVGSMSTWYYSTGTKTQQSYGNNAEMDADDGKTKQQQQQENPWQTQEKDGSQMQKFKILQRPNNLEDQSPLEQNTGVMPSTGAVQKTKYKIKEKTNDWTQMLYDVPPESENEPADGNMQQGWNGEQQEATAPKKKKKKKKSTGGQSMGGQQDWTSEIYGSVPGSERELSKSAATGRKRVWSNSKFKTQHQQQEGSKKAKLSERERLQKRLQMMAGLQQELAKLLETDSDWEAVLAALQFAPDSKPSKTFGQKQKWSYGAMPAGKSSKKKKKSSSGKHFGQNSGGDAENVKYSIKEKTNDWTAMLYGEEEESGNENTDASKQGQKEGGKYTIKEKTNDWSNIFGSIMAGADPDEVAGQTMWDEAEEEEYRQPKQQKRGGKKKKQPQQPSLSANFSKIGLLKSLQKKLLNVSQEKQVKEAPPKRRVLLPDPFIPDFDNVKVQNLPTGKAKSGGTGLLPDPYGLNPAPQLGQGQQPNARRGPLLPTPTVGSSVFGMNQGQQFQEAQLTRGRGLLPDPVLPNTATGINQPLMSSNMASGSGGLLPAPRASSSSAFDTKDLQMRPLGTGTLSGMSLGFSTPSFRDFEFSTPSFRDDYMLQRQRSLPYEERGAFRSDGMSAQSRYAFRDDTYQSQLQRGYEPRSARNLDSFERQMLEERLNDRLRSLALASDRQLGQRLEPRYMDELYDFPPDYDPYDFYDEMPYEEVPPQKTKAKKKKAADSGKKDDKADNEAKLKRKKKKKPPTKLEGAEAIMDEKFKSQNKNKKNTWSIMIENKVGFTGLAEGATHIDTDIPEQTPVTHQPETPSDRGTSSMIRNILDSMTAKQASQKKPEVKVIKSTEKKETRQQPLGNKVNMWSMLIEEKVGFTGLGESGTDSKMETDDNATHGKDGDDEEFDGEFDVLDEVGDDLGCEEELQEDTSASQQEETGENISGKQASKPQDEFPAEAVECSSAQPVQQSPSITNESTKGSVQGQTASKPMRKQNKQPPGIDYCLNFTLDSQLMDTSVSLKESYKTFWHKGPMYNPNAGSSKARLDLIVKKWTQRFELEEEKREQLAKEAAKMDQDKDNEVEEKMEVCDESEKEHKKQESSEVCLISLDEPSWSIPEKYLSTNDGTDDADLGKELWEMYPVSSGLVHKKEESLIEDYGDPGFISTEYVVTDAVQSGYRVLKTSQQRALKLLNEDPDNDTARASLVTTSKMMKEMEKSMKKVGQYTGVIEVRPLSAEDIEHPEAFIDIDQFEKAPMIEHGKGAELLVKLGWMPRQPLGVTLRGGLFCIRTLNYKFNGHCLSEFIKHEQWKHKVCKKLDSGHVASESGEKWPQIYADNYSPLEALEKICRLNGWKAPLYTNISVKPNEHIFKVTVNGNSYVSFGDSKKKTVARKKAAVAAMKANGIRIHI